MDESKKTKGDRQMKACLLFYKTSRRIGLAVQEGIRCALRLNGMRI